MRISKLGFLLGLTTLLWRILPKFAFFLPLPALSFLTKRFNTIGIAYLEADTSTWSVRHTYYCICNDDL